MRRIMLTLADDTTATECGACPHAMGVRCYAFRAYVGGDRVRLPDCLAAEAAAAGMVEIAPEDIAKVRFDLWAPNGEVEECDAADRVDNALRAHAAKAEVKR